MHRKSADIKSSFTAAVDAFSLSTVCGLNIFLSNDDGFASAQLVETFKLLKTAGWTYRALRYTWYVPITAQSSVTNKQQATMNLASEDVKCSPPMLYLS